MARSEIRTRIAAIIEADKVALGLKRVERFTPDSIADWEEPLVFVSGTSEAVRYPQNEKMLQRGQTWNIRILYQEVGQGWTADIQDNMDDLIDALYTLFNGNPNLRLSDAGLAGVDQVQWLGVRIDTPYSYPVGQTRKLYHSAEMSILVQFSQLCQS